MYKRFKYKVSARIVDTYVFITTFSYMRGILKIKYINHLKLEVHLIVRVFKIKVLPYRKHSVVITKIST
jgi:hypothetical protein